MLSWLLTRGRSADQPVESGSGVPLDLACFAIVDFETTGLFANAHHRVIEVGVVCVNEDGDVLGEFDTLVNPRRDLGPTALHGIRARDVAEAPEFGEIAGDIAACLHESVVVAHNIRFERSFLSAEFERTGMPTPDFPSLCTMALASRFGRGSARRLEDCCAAFSIRHARSHSALDDARATSELLACLLREARKAGIATLDELGCEPLPPAAWPIISPSKRAVRRSEAARRPAERSYLGELVSRLPAGATSVGDEAAVAYLDVLDRALEDRRLTHEEAQSLELLALDWGIDGARLRELHEGYLSALVTTALADQYLSEAERADLLDVATLLGMGEPALDELVAASSDHCSETPAAPPQPLRREELRGLTICFTGQLTSTLRGAALTRERAQALAEEAGMHVRPSVTKTLDVLVVADPDTMSGKARKARDYGTRIIAERALWQALGVSVD